MNRNNLKLTLFDETNPLPAKEAPSTTDSPISSPTHSPSMPYSPLPQAADTAAPGTFLPSSLLAQKAIAKSQHEDTEDPVLPLHRMAMYARQDSCTFSTTEEMCHEGTACSHERTTTEGDCNSAPSSSRPSLANINVRTSMHALAARNSLPARDRAASFKRRHSEEPRSQSSLAASSMNVDSDDDDDDNSDVHGSVSSHGHRRVASIGNGECFLNLSYPPPLSTFHHLDLPTASPPRSRNPRSPFNRRKSSPISPASPLHSRTSSPSILERRRSRNASSGSTTLALSLSVNGNGSDTENEEDLRKESWEESKLDQLFLAGITMDIDEAARLHDPFRHNGHTSRRCSSSTADKRHSRQRSHSNPEPYAPIVARPIPRTSALAASATTIVTANTATSS